MARLDKTKITEEEQCKYIEIMEKFQEDPDSITREEARLVFELGSQMYVEHPLEKILKNFSNKEKEILKIATNAIYFDDNSDYLPALWDIIKEIAGDSIEDCDKEVFSLLNKE